MKMTNNQLLTKFKEYWIDVAIILVPVFLIFFTNAYFLKDIFQRDWGLVAGVFLIYFIMMACLHFWYVTRKISGFMFFWSKIAALLLIELGLSALFYQDDKADREYQATDTKITQYIETEQKHISNAIERYKDKLSEVYGREYVEAMYAKQAVMPIETLRTNVNQLLVDNLQCPLKQVSRDSITIENNRYDILTETTTAFIAPSFTISCRNGKEYFKNINLTLKAYTEQLITAQKEIEKLTGDKSDNEHKVNFSDDSSMEGTASLIIEFIASRVFGFSFILFLALVCIFGTHIYYPQLVFRYSSKDSTFPRDLFLEQLLKANLMQENGNVTAHKFLEDKRIIRLNPTIHQNIIKELHIKGIGIKKCYLLDIHFINRLIELKIIDKNDGYKNDVFYIFDSSQFDNFFAYSSRLKPFFVWHLKGNSFLANVKYFIQTNKLTTLIIVIIVLLLIIGPLVV